ncbi:protein kinase [Cystobacter fuscus]|uniref:serine/threonine protein kinase n=1 Tax=Cystobacter fuscus TaxID=43 RepID=UPI002B2EAB38|nr:protein kinase [Cystobacter fuscus]
MSTNRRETTTYPDVLEPGTQVGRWRVVKRLGVGGQGAVYLVEDANHPGDFFALKLALYARDGRSEREVALMMSRAAHPHVVGFHGCARWPHPREGYLGFVMDWVPGLALDVWAETDGTTFRQLATAGATVAHTLGELHARGVLHRDLKPEHILMLQMAIVEARPVAPALVNPRVPRALSDVIVRLLAKDPSERYPSGAALHAALSEAVASEEAAWDASIFEWGEAPPTQEGGIPERHLLRPPRPKPSWSVRPSAPAPAPARMERRSDGFRSLVLATAVLLALVPVMIVTAVAPGVRVPDEEWATDVRVGPESARYEQAPLPVRNQKMAPCTAKLEVELSGACWFPHRQRPPDCPPQTVAYRGECLLPVQNSRPVPTSVDGGAP